MADYHFVNQGEVAVTVTEIKSSCGCTVAKMEKMSYGAGERGKLTASFTIGDRVGTHRKTISVTTSDGTTSQLVLTAIIPRLVEVKPVLLFWRPDEARTGKTIEVTAAAGIPLDRVEILSSDPRIKPELTTRRDGRAYSITVDPAGVGESVAATLTIHASSAGGDKIVNAYVRLP